jgi:cytochrome c556
MRWTGLVVAALVALGASAAVAKDDPAHERHELMEGVGKNAKKIGDALKAGKPAEAAAPAQAIADAMDRFRTLFPEGSQNADSRAKPEIWTERAKFDGMVTALKEKATALAAAAKSGGDAGAAAAPVWKECKSCHDAFRVPEDDE